MLCSNFSVNRSHARYKVFRNGERLFNFSHHTQATQIILHPGVIVFIRGLMSESAVLTPAAQIEHESGSTKVSLRTCAMEALYEIETKSKPVAETLFNEMKIATGQLVSQFKEEPSGQGPGCAVDPHKLQASGYQESLTTNISGSYNAGGKSCAPKPEPDFYFLENIEGYSTNSTGFDQGPVKLQDQGTFKSEKKLATTRDMKRFHNPGEVAVAVPGSSQTVQFAPQIKKSHMVMPAVAGNKPDGEIRDPETGELIFSRAGPAARTSAQAAILLARFGSKQAMIEELKRLAKNDEPPVPLRVDPPINKKLHLQCSRCDRYYHNETRFQTHLPCIGKLNVTLPKTLPCPRCGQKFQEPQDLNSHVRVCKK